MGRSRILIGLALSGLSAVLLIVIWQSYGNLWWLTVVAFVPMYLAQYRFLPRRWSAIPVAIAFAAHYVAVALLSSSVVPISMIVGTAAVSAAKPPHRPLTCVPRPTTYAAPWRTAAPTGTLRGLLVFTDGNPA
jgi:hypothetical protein